MSNVVLYQKPSLVDWVTVCYALAADQREQYEAFNGPFDPETVAALGFQRIGPRWVLYVDEKPVAIAGFDQIRPGVWQDYLFSGEAIWGTHWRTITKHVKRVMDHMLGVGGAHRLQCVSLASRIHAHRWYGCIGLAPEGTLKAYGLNGEDAIMFARVKSDG